MKTNNTPINQLFLDIHKITIGVIIRIIFHILFIRKNNHG